MGQPAFDKRQRERARRERAAAKNARRDERRASRDTDTSRDAEPIDEAAILAELAALHARFDAGEIEFDDFVAAKAELTARLI